MNMPEEDFMCSKSFSEGAMGLDRGIHDEGLRVLQKQTVALKGTSSD